MILYKFNSEIIDLITFHKKDNLTNKDFIINNDNRFISYCEIKNFLCNDKYYDNILKEFDIIEEFNNNIFFKIYNKVEDFEIFKVLFSETVDENSLLKVKKSIDKINKVFNFEDNISFFNFIDYYKRYKNNVFIRDSNNINIKDYYVKMNYTTFRTSNSFVNKKNKEISELLQCGDDYCIVEFDVRSSDLFFILFTDFLKNRNSELIRKIMNSSVYDVVDIDVQSYDEKKKEILILLYSYTGGELTKKQADIISSLGLEELIDYLDNNESISLINDIKRTVDNKLAYFGQSCTSLYMMIVYNNLRKLIKSFKKDNKILYTKYDSIVACVEKNKIDILKNDFFVKFDNIFVNYLDNHYIIDSHFEKMFNLIFKRNLKINIFI